MFTTIRNRFNWRSSKTRATVAALICTAGLALGVGGTAVPGSETPPNNEQCLNTNTLCPFDLPANVIAMCNVSPGNVNDDCFNGFSSPQQTNFSCRGNYPGLNCTDTTMTTLIPCFTFIVGHCTWEQPLDTKNRYWSVLVAAGLKTVQTMPRHALIISSAPVQEYRIV